MQPLNQAERRKAFINFILFFIITIAVVVTTVFFSVQVPFKQNALLREEIALVERERSFADAFVVKMSETMNKLDSVNLPDQKVPELVDGQIKDNLNKLNIMISNDSVSSKSMYQNVVLSLEDLRNTKKQLRDLSGKDVSISDYISQIDRLKSQLSQTEQQVTTLTLMLRQK
jgi:hypothetical protein